MINGILLSFKIGNGSPGFFVTLMAPLLFTSSLFAAEISPTSQATAPKVLSIAGVVTEYRSHSHADVLLSRLLKTSTLDGSGPTYPLKLVSVYVDQIPEKDLSRDYAAQYGFRHSPTIEDALTLGTGRLAVDGVMLIAEHGDYPVSETGQIIYPKRRFFSEICNVFQKSKHVVPVFNDKHLADTTQDALWFYEQARELKIPLMAGSSITSTWRSPAIDVPRDAQLEELLVLSYGPLDAYGFHALDFAQSLAERRQGGETGVKRVWSLSEDQVWKEPAAGGFDPRLLEAAAMVLKKREPLQAVDLMKMAREPVAFCVEYQDGLRTTVVTLNGPVVEWAAAWRVRDTPEIAATTIDLQDEIPFMHFGQLMSGLVPFFQTATPTWPVERTLFSSILLDKALTSRFQKGAVLETPELNRAYVSPWNWSQPASLGRAFAAKP